MKMKNKSWGRTYAFKYLFSKLGNNNALSEDHDYSDFEETYIQEDIEHEDNETSLESRLFGKKLIEGLYKNLEALKENVSNALTKKNYDKLDNIEKALLLLGAYEITFDKTPKSIVINEYLNIAKSYLDDKNTKLINGVLDNLA